ncbi:hypothetical protein ADUPG1_003132, partial [Aduncisulcus paluster]
SYIPRASEQDRYSNSTLITTIDSVSSQQELDAVFNSMIQEGKMRMQLRHLSYKERNPAHSRIPRRITSIEQLPPNLPWELQIALDPLVSESNIDMSNAQLSWYHSNVTTAQRSEHFEFHRKCFKDLSLAINPRIPVTPPPSILPAYLERYTDDVDDLDPPSSPLPTKFAVETIRIVDTKRAMGGINSASGP